MSVTAPPGRTGPVVDRGVAGVAPPGTTAPGPARRVWERLGGGRLAPALPAAGAVVAAGVAFGRVFGFSTMVPALVLAAVIGALGGIAGRLVLLPGESAPGTQAAEAEPGEALPAWQSGGATAPGAPRASSAAPVGRPLGAAVAVAVATLVATVVVAVASASPRPGLGAAVSKGIGALGGGWSRILTTSVPVPPTVDRLPLLAGVVALAMGLTVVVATRPHPGLGVLVPAAAVLVVALALGVDGPGSVVAVTTAPAILAGIYLLVVSQPTDEGVAWIPPARSAAALVTGAVVVIVALLVGPGWPLATARAPFNLRSKLTPPVNLGTTPNPLALLPARQAEPRTVMFRAHVDQAWLQSPTDWRLVSLDVFTGAGWTTDAHAVRAGTVLGVPSGIEASQLGASSSQRITVASLTGPWVPTTGIPTGVRPPDLAYDPATVTLIDSPSAQGKVFTLHSRLPAPTREALDSAGVTVSSSNAALTAVPACLPPELARLATTATEGVDRPDQEAVALEQSLADRDGFASAPTADPGSSCGRLKQFLATRRGTVEQFATAYVLMARTVGLPARLAVGFTPGSVNAGAGTTTVSGSDATVWPEVDLAHVGWVAFDPVPASTTARTGGGAATTSTTVDRSQNGLNQVRRTVATNSATTSPYGRHGPGPGPGAGIHHGSSAWWWLILVVVVLALGGLPAGRIVARRRRRAKRRSAALAPTERIAGAWAEVLDAMAPFHPDVASSTPTEVADLAGRSVPGAAPAVEALAFLVDLSVYAGLGDDDAAGRAWEHSDRAVGVLRRAVPAGLRIRHLLVAAPRRPRPAAASPPRDDTDHLAGNEGIRPVRVGAPAGPGPER